jgi:hypothetical protein
MKCNELIERVYLHPKFTRLIHSIRPTHLQDELRQEVAMVLLEYDCERLLQMEREQKIVSFAMRVAWKMGTLPKGKFYKVFRKNLHIDIEGKDIEQIDDDFPKDELQIAEASLKSKFYKNANETHEAMIFTKYIELQSCQKVATYFNIPRLHAFQVIKKVKKELKKNFK